MLYAIFGVLVIILDQAVKYWVAGNIPWQSGGETFIPGIVSLVNIHNDGAAFSFLSGSNARIFFIILTGVFTLAVIIALATKFISGPLARWSIVMVTAGGLSNCIDRVIYGYVQDMFKCEFVNFPIFNVADIFITVFALLFVLAIIFEREPKYDDDYEDDYDEDYDEDEDDYEEPVRRKEKKAKKAKRSRKARDYDEDEDEEEEEEPQPRARRAAVKQESAPAKKKAPRYEEEEEAPRARRAAPQPVEKKASAPKQAAARSSKYDAAFEQARARRVAAQQESAPATKKSSVNRQDMDDLFADWDRANNAGSASKPAAQSVAAPKPVQARPAAPASKPVSSSASDEFSLDDILAEFK